MRQLPLRARPVLVVEAGLLLSIPIASACSQQPSDEPSRSGDHDIERQVALVRETTEAFKSLDAAVAAGYSDNVTSCVENPPAGGMGFHHQNEALLDDRVELERPEILVYERLADGGYRLNGVEYVVPFSAHPADAEAPTVMGRELKPAPSLGIWYRHVWIWLENPSGLFADWNPRVECRPTPDATMSHSISPHFDDLHPESHVALTESDVAAIRALIEQDAEAVRREEWSSVARMFTVDAVRFPPNRPPVRGRDAIREWLETFPSIQDFDITADEIAGCGDVAFVRGRYVLTVVPDAGAPPETDRGHYMGLLRRQADGSWLWSTDMVSSELPSGP